MWSCRSQPGFTLLPLEHLAPQGCDAALATWLRDECKWSQAQLDLVSAGLALYWERATELAEQTPTWPSPRIRNLGVVTQPELLRPFAQVLNTSTWTLYATDLQPEHSNPELIAYLLALGDWMAMTGEVTQAPLRSAAWWITATPAAKADLARAASSGTSPDAASLIATAEALSWIDELQHRDLTPALKNGNGTPEPASEFREVPGTGLFVPLALAEKPVAWVGACRQSAIIAVESFRNAWPRASGSSVKQFCQWIEAERPTVVLHGNEREVIWDCREAADCDALASVLSKADEIALQSIRSDVQLIDEHSKRFLAALTEPDELARPEGTLAEGGYSYMHEQRRVVCYNLFEVGMERLTGPPLPFESEMLGARTWHEWAHLGDESGWIDSGVHCDDAMQERAALEEALQRIVDRCPEAPRKAAEDNLAELVRTEGIGVGLAKVLFSRLPDYRANRLARLFMSDVEAETYARHNIRTLRREYPSTKMWSALLRYLYEYQYLLPDLRLIEVADPYRYFTLSTGFGRDFIERGILNRDGFLETAELLGRLCARTQVRSDYFREDLLGGKP